MFNLFAPRPLLEKSPRWATLASNRFPLVFGLSPFAHLFLCSQDEARFAVLATEQPELVEVKSTSTKEFVDEFLGRDDIRERLFSSVDLKSLVSRLGALNADECFYSVLHPGLEGSGLLKAVVRGNAWEHLDRLGRVLGL